MRRINRLLSAAVAVMILGSSFSGSVSALGAENADTGETSTVFEAAGAGWTTDAETAAEEEPETETGTHEETLPADTEGSDKESSDVREGADSADAEQDDNIVPEPEEGPLQDQEIETPETEDVTEEKASDLEVPETKDAARTGNAYFVIDGEGYTFSLYDGDVTKIAASRSKDNIVFTDAYGDRAVLSEESVRVSDSSDNEIITVGDEDFMVCANGSFAAESEGKTYIINGSLGDAPEEFVFYPVSYTEDSLTLAFSDEEGACLPFAISAEEGYRAGEWSAPSDADVSGTDNGFSGTAVCSGTDMSDGNTFRFSFAEDKETADNAPLPDTDKPVENAKADDGQKNEDITAETGEETVSKEASDTVVISGCEYTVTYDANGGSFEGGSDKNVVNYHIPDRYISKTDNVSDDGEKTGAYGNKLFSVDTVTIPEAEKLYVTITYQTGRSGDYVYVYDGSVVPTTYNYDDSVSGTLNGKVKTTRTYEIAGDTVQFCFKSDNSDNDYFGYYAEVSDSPLFGLDSEGYEAPTYSNRRLVSWNTNADGSGTTVDISSAVLRSDMTLYAQYENTREVVWFEDGSLVVKDTDEPMDRYTAEHGAVIKREFLNPANVNITNTWDDVRFQDGYFNNEDSLEACIRDTDGKYVVFNENNEYSGTSDEIQSFAIDNVNKIYLPDGDYTLSFKDENTEELAGRHILGSYEDFVDDHEPIKLRYNSQINAREEGSGINVVAVKLRTDLHFFNISPTEEPPARIKLSAKNGDDDDENGYYKYTRTENGNDVIYTYDMKNGTEDWISLEPGKKTIVRDTPHGQAGFDIIYPVTGWKYVFGFGKSGDHLYKTENNGDLWIKNGTSLAQSSSFIVAAVEDLYAVKTYHKYTATKRAASAKFCLTTGINEDDVKYVLDHYDTYEYNGRQLVNVYIPRRETKNLDDPSGNTFIDTDDNGEFTILYPAMMYDRGGTRTSSNYKFYLYEVDSEKGTFADNKYTVFADYTNLDDSIWKIYNKKTGEEINSAALRQSNVINLSADDFEVRETATPEQRNRLNLSTQGIRNLEVPYIEKIVPQGYIPKETEYLVDLYRYGVSGLEKIATVPIKAGEKKYLIPEEIEGLTYEDMRGLYIEEQTPEGWTAKYEGNVSYNQNSKKYIFNANALYSGNPHITITNTRNLYGLVIIENVENGEGEHTHRFKVKVWDEINGKEYPLVGLDLTGHVTDENGEAYFDITTNGENPNGIGMGVPYGSHYKIEEISSTLGKYTVSKTNDTGIITGSITQSVWTNSTNPCDVVISKTDINGHEIAGAQMKVTGRADGEDADIEPITWTSVEGQDKTIQLYPGTYTLHEEAAPGSGEYVTASDITFVVKHDGTVTVGNKDVDKVTMVDGYAPVELEIVKIMANSYKEYTSTISVQFWSEEDGQRTPLAGYIVPDTDYVTDDEGRLQVNITTDTANSGGRITLKLPRGTHYRVEETEPADPNVNFAYALKNSQKLDGASAEGILTRKDSITFNNIMYSYVEIEKVDQNGSYMPGAVMQILDNGSTVVKEWTTTGAKDTVYLKPSIGANYNAPQYYVLHEKIKPADAAGYADDIRFGVLPAYPNGEKARIINLGSNAEVSSLRMMNIDKSKGHSLTIKKIYDDNGTGAVLSQDMRFDFAVLIKGLPQEYCSFGLDTDEAYIKNCGAENLENITPPGRYPDVKVSHIGPNQGTFLPDHFFKPESGNSGKYYTSFYVRIKPGEKFSVYDLPEGAEYEVIERGSNLWSLKDVFDISYKDCKGTINKKDVTAEITNKQKTIKLKVSKKVFGYDDGTVFYLAFISARHVLYESFNAKFTDRDGIERSFFKTVDNEDTCALIPFRPEDGEIVITLPILVHWFADEYIPKSGTDMSQYTYEDLLTGFKNGGFGHEALTHGSTSGTIAGYRMIASVLSSGSNRTNDFYAYYQNQSRLVAFDKKDTKGVGISGAHMAVIDKDTGETVEEWVSDENGPHAWNVGNIITRTNYKTFAGKKYILREMQPPRGYEKAEDIEFTLKAHIGTTKPWITGLEDSSEEAEYFYPYIDTGDGQEKLMLVMIDQYSFHDVVISKTDINGHEIAGAQMKVTGREEGALTDITPITWTSEEGKDKKIQLHPGSYTLREEAVPESGAYIKASDISFTVKEDGKVSVNGKDVSKVTMVNIDTSKLHDLTLKKIYDDNGTGAVINKNGRFGFQVTIRNLPAIYREKGLDFDAARVKNFGADFQFDWMSNSIRDGFITDSEITHLDGDLLRPESGGSTYYASFFVWMKPGEEFKLHDLPEGASYMIKEVADTMKNYEQDSEERMFDISYTNNSGTISEDDVETVVTNTLRTIDLKFSKEVLGYDDGRMFYLVYRAKDNTYCYDSIIRGFTDRDGVERSFIHVNDYTYGLIPFRPEDGEQVIKIPALTNWFIDEYVIKADVDLTEYTYEDLLDLAFIHNTYTSGDIFAYGTDQFQGYMMAYYPTTSGTNRTKDFDLKYKNASRMIAFRKTDAAGIPISGAKMQIIDKESGSVVKEWISDKDKPFIWNVMTTLSINNIFSNDYDGSKVFILHEAEAPKGYDTAEDIEFTIKKHVGTVTYNEDKSKIERQASYFYPYIDTGDGQEKLTLTMADEVEKHDVVISKTDINGHEIAGAQLKITGREEDASADITPIAWVSEEGKNRTVQLRPGTYTLHEEAAPESGLYIKADDITFTVDKDGKVKVDGNDVDKVTMIDEYNTASLRVKKTVTGDMGNKNDVFDFTMTLTDSKNAAYAKTISYKKGTETGILTPDRNGKVSFTLSHGETIEFTDLLIGTKYEVSEKNYSENGYTTSSKNASGTVAKTNPDVEFTNSKNIMVPTGIREDFPWVMVVVMLAGIVYIAVFRRQRY